MHWVWYCYGFRLLKRWLAGKFKAGSQVIVALDRTQLKENNVLMVSVIYHWLTNLADCETAIKIYKQRFGIEAMFRDCKTGGYNLEGSKANPDRLMRLIFLIALAMTSAWLHRQRTKFQKQESYICRIQEKVKPLNDTVIFG